MATRVMARIRTLFQLDLPLRTLFNAPTVAQLTTLIEQARAAGSGRETPPVTPAPRQPEMPLAFAQQRLWFINQYEPENPFYNIPRGMQLQDPAVTALEQAIEALTQRHEILRTTYADKDGIPFQRIHSRAEPSLTVVDLTGPIADSQGLAHEIVAREVMRPFDLARGPMLRIVLLRLDQRHYQASFTMHHIASDGWSMGILIEEVIECYRAALQQRPIRLQPLPLQYADYAVWQRRWLEGPVMEAQIDYWRRQLADVPPLNLPLDKPRPAVQAFRGATEFFELPTDLSRKLTAFCNAQGVTLYMLLLATFQTLLHRYSGQRDFAVGSPIAGRAQRELEGLIGFFINTLVLRADLHDDPDFSDLLKRVRETTLEAYAHQDVPFERLVDALLPERDLSRTPLFQVLLVLENAPRDHGESETDASADFATADTGTAKFEITLMMAETGKHLAGGFQYNTDLFEAGTIRRMIDHFTALLREVVDNPYRRLSTYPLIEAHQQQAAVGDFMDDLEE
jgi:hypothetical protein